MKKLSNIVTREFSFSICGLYLDKTFTSHRIRYNPTPVPANKTNSTKAIRMCFASIPILPLNQSDTPKIILNFYNLLVIL